MPDHLWPARAGYLRRGTPVVVEVGFRGLQLFALVGSAAISDKTGTRAFCLYASQQAPDGYAPLDDIHLDLRDVTARAHAAWDWTVAHRSGLRLADHLPLGASGGGTMLRMASGDESVTVAEARAALEWAEGVQDG